MNAALLLQNLAIFSVQITAVIAATGLALWALRMRSAKAKLAVWRFALVCCLALPWFTPRLHVGGKAAESNVTATSTVVSPGDEERGTPLHWPLSLSATALLAIGSGIALRLVWLGTGLLNLRGIARRARPMRPAPPSVDRARWLAGAEARFSWSDEVAGPVTFGYRSPVVLLPPDFAQLSEGEQISVALHEALHVVRRDWIFTMGEEVVRALLWFHPAVWFLLNRVQLAREQAVDEAVVSITRESDEYVGALLKIAAARIEPDLAPAPLFLKRRHLHERVDALIKGAHMNRSRFLLSTLAVLLTVPVVAGLIAWQLPLRAAAQTDVPDSAGVEVKTGPFKVLHRAPVMYPIDARDKGEAGTVVVSVTVDSSGEVTDARVVSATGPAELRRAVLSSVLQWHFSTDPVELAPGDRRPVPSNFEIAVGFNPSQTAKMPAAAPPTPDNRPLVTIDKIDVSRVPAELQSKVLAALTVREGQGVRFDEISAQQAVLKKVDSHLTLGIVRPRGAEAQSEKVSLSIALRQPVINTDRVVPPVGDKTPQMPQKIRVGGGVAAVNLITKVTPLYPPAAKEARVQGSVRLLATIGKEGQVEELQLVSGHPLLVQAAVDAVKQWVYRPTLLNGNPVSVLTEIDVNFTLAP